MNSSVQYSRISTLVVSDNTGNSLDLSLLRIIFRVKKSDAETPNSAIIRIYNLSQNTVNFIRGEFTRVTLNAGYESNFGLIFDGNIKQVSYGKENSTDNYIDIAAGDGDQAYNFAVVNKTLAAGSSQRDQILAAAKAMDDFGVSIGFLSNIDSPELPRGKVMFGMSREYMTQSSKSVGSTWSIQNGKIEVIKKTSTIPSQAIILNSKNGVVGAPKLTNDGVQIRALLNPTIKVGVKIKINNEDINDSRLSETSSRDSVNNAPSKSADGIYRVLVVEYIGDNFGNDWFSDITCLAVDETAPQDSEVSPA